MINRKLQTYTRIFIGVIIGVVIIYDIWVAVVGGTGTTVSHELINWFYDYPISAFAAGVVLGHLAWRMPSTPDTAKRDPYVRELQKQNEELSNFLKWVYVNRHNTEIGRPAIVSMASEVLDEVYPDYKEAVRFDESRNEN